MTRTRITTNGLADASVTYAKMQNVAADRLLGRSAGAGTVQEIVCTSAGRALIDDADAAAQRATLGLGSIIDVGGNVGIGTASPVRPLHVNSTGFFAARITSTDPVATVVELNHAAGTWELSVNGTTGTTGAAGTFYFWQQGVGARMVISPTGNVGIGTASPGSRLEVIHGGGQGINCLNNGGAGTVNYALMGQAAGTASANTGVLVNCLNANENYGVRILNPPAGANNYAIYADAAAKSYFAGNVGIGTTTPVTNLHVVDATSPDIRLSGAGPSLDVLTTTTAGVVGTSTNHPLVLRANGVDRWRMQSDGALSTTAVGDTNNTLRPAGHVRAWARWTGTLTGTNSPVRSFNVTSVTRSSLGLYLVNLASALSSDDGVAVASAVSSTTLTDLGQFNNMANAVVINSTTVRVASADASNVFQDNAIMSVIVCDL